MKDQKNNIKVGFTTGDMNGVGPEILLKSLQNNELLSICTPVIYGPLKNLNHTLTHLGFDMSFNKISSASFKSILILSNSNCFLSSPLRVLPDGNFNF